MKFRMRADTLVDEPEYNSLLSGAGTASLDHERIEARACILLQKHQLSLYKQTDRMFAFLLIGQWLAGILVACIFSPLTWAGTYSNTHIHVWTAIFLGALIVFPPVILIAKSPGKAVTRYTIATAQMLYSALLIHLTGGRIETHFHVFGSLAFLSFYRDWRVLIPATVVVAGDHLLRGIYFPQSVYGVASIEPWRWLEHAWWVVFENSILISMCRRSAKEMWLVALRQAEIEETNSNIEHLVCKRTEELREAKSWATMQYQIVRSLAEASSWRDAIGGTLRSLVYDVSENHGKTWCAFWSNHGRNQGTLDCVSAFELPNGEMEEFRQFSESTSFELGQGLPGNVWLSKKAISWQNFGEKFIRLGSAEHCGLSNAVAFPILHRSRFFGIIEIITESKFECDLEALESLGRQIGQFLARKEAESERERLANIVLRSSDAIITMSADNTIASWNKGAEQIFKYKKDEALACHISILMPGNGEHELHRLLEASLRAGERIESYETTLIDRNNHHIDILLFAIPWFTESGEYEGCSLTCHNITERKEAERRVAEFYSVVSHELRTPITSIRGVLGLIESQTVEPGSEEAMELVSVARSSSDRLIRLINDMLDLKKIESGKMELSKSKIEIDELVSCTLSSLSGMAELADIKLVSDIATDAVVFADWDKATQIITNLVSNAIKFSPPGGIVRVSAECTAACIRFRVIDNGPGIAADDIEKLFNKFKQLDSSDSRSTGGTGLGLAISKALVEQHGGRIGVNSKPGEGSEFWFELPSTVTSAKLTNNRMGKAIVFEDDGELAQLISVQLKNQNFKVNTVNSSFLAEEAVTNERPDLVLVNLAMPEAAGLNFIKFLRDRKETVDVPVIGITANYEEDNLLSGAAVSIDWFCPSNENDSLVNTLKRVRPASSKCKILVADDDDELRTVLIAQLAGLGLECLEAHNGIEALQLVKSESPDLIMLDVMMPGLDGFGVVEKLRREESTRHLPLIIYTCKDLNGREREQLSLGITKYLIKGDASQRDLAHAINDLLLKINPETLETNRHKKVKGKYSGAEAINA